MKPIRIVLVDNHCIVRQGLRSILDPDPRFEVVGEAATGADALRLVAEQQPDLVLLDLKLPDTSGVELCQPMIHASPQTAVVILTAFLDRHLVEACLRAGARGYLLKEAENLHLQEHLLNAVQGHAALDPRAADFLVNHIRSDSPRPELLNGREIEILRLVSRGFSNGEVASQLCLSENTVKGYMKDILVKLQVHNRIEAVLQAKEQGLI
jgi:DNA-binding NarL/FixJ family response regulator